MYAIIRDRGRQYRVEKGATIDFDVTHKKPGEQVEFADVLVYHDGEKVTVGTPTIAGVKVIGEVIKDGRDRKIRVYKYKRREGYHRTVGHRQQFSSVRIKDIVKG